LFKQTKLQFTDTINSDTINVDNLSVDSAQIDNLTLADKTDPSPYAPYPMMDLRQTNIVVSGIYPQMRFGYDAYTGAPPTGSSWLNQVLFTTKNFDIYTPAPSEGRCNARISGKLDITNPTGYTNHAELNVDGPATFEGNVVINGTLTVAQSNPSLKASGSWKFDGTNLVPRRAPFNCSATRLGTGYYRIDFTTPMSSPNYVISAVSTQWDGNASVSMGEYGIRTSSSFYVLAQYRIFSSSGGSTDVDFDVLVFD
jgi:hypothetical protein